MHTMTLDIASRIVDAAIAAGRAQSFKPLTVVVLDAGGHDVALKREDGSGIMRAEIARGKAWGALGMGVGSRDLARRAEQNPRFFAALAATSGGRLVPNPGGVLIRNQEGTVLGAVGVTGDTSDHDEVCASSAIESAGLVADCG